MSLRIVGSIWLGVLIVVASGCHQSPAEAAHTSKLTSGPVQLIARFHWLGKEGIAADTNSARLMQIWHEPESTRLEAQTLDRLAEFPWVPANASIITAGRLVASNADVGGPIVVYPHSTNALRPLLDDVLLKESYLEVRTADTNDIPELTFAIRLDEPRAALWQTNLAAVLESLTGTRSTPTTSGWELRPAASSASPDTRHAALSTAHIQLARIQGWTLLTFSNPNSSPSTNADTLLATLHTANSSTNWLEADFDARRLAVALGMDCQLPEGFPEVSLEVYGDGHDVHTRGELRLSKPLSLALQPWTVPTNLISRSLFSFTAARGTAPFFAKLLSWLSSTNQPSVAMASAAASGAMSPDQVYLWDDLGAPFHNYFALASTQASNLVSRIGLALMAEINPRLGPRYGSISMDTNHPGGFTWTGLYHAAPFLEPITNSGVQFVYGGFGPQFVASTSQMPRELVTHLNEGTNLVYFDWEITGQRLMHLRYLDDLYRIVFELRGPRLSYSASLHWIARNLTNLQHSVTEVKLVDPERLAFARKSTIGLTAGELDYLANWLELPRFPYGLTTLMTTNPLPPNRPSGMLRTTRQNGGAANLPTRP